MEAMLFGLLIALTSAGLAALLTRMMRLRKDVDELRTSVEVFSEASIRVADTLDELLKGSVEPRKPNQASRRYLLAQARERLARGEPLPALAQGLGLSHDEVMLLQHAARQAA